MSAQIEINIPTTNSETVIGETLDALATAVKNSPLSIKVLRVVDDNSEDNTTAIVREKANKYNWLVTTIEKSTTLPEARQMLIDRTDSEWFLFLDDDVRLTKNYLTRLWDVASNSNSIGAIQGRKLSRDEHPSTWTRRRTRRGGTHATLIRTESVEGIEYPENLTVLEDEYTRRYIEKNGYLWIFNHLARFEHANQNRHPIGWEEGLLAGLYNLAPGHQYTLTIPHAIVTKRNPLPHVKRLFGWTYGRTLSVAGEYKLPVKPMGEKNE